MSKTNMLLAVVALVMIGVGLIKPDLSILMPRPDRSDSSVVLVEKPTDQILLEKTNLVVESFSNSSSSSKKQDSVRLSSLYQDIALLVSMDENEEVIKTTEEIRQANSLAGLMLRLDIKGKYPGLSDAAESVIVSQIGDDVVPLDKSLREKAVNAFKALSWACYEGSK